MAARQPPKRPARPKPAVRPRKPTKVAAREGPAPVRTLHERPWYLQFWEWLSK